MADFFLDQPPLTPTLSPLSRGEGVFLKQLLFSLDHIVISIGFGTRLAHHLAPFHDIRFDHLAKLGLRVAIGIEA